MNTDETTPEFARLTADVVLLGQHDGQLCVLLIRRGWPPFEGCWALPGGHIDAGEASMAAVRRELREETGLSGCELSWLGVYADPGRDPRGRYVTFVYTATLTGSLPIPVAGDDAHEARWWPVAELGELSAQPDGRSRRLAFDHDQILLDALAKARRP